MHDATLALIIKTTNTLSQFLERDNMAKMGPCGVASRYSHGCLSKSVGSWCMGQIFFSSGFVGFDICFCFWLCYGNYLEGCNNTFDISYFEFLVFLAVGKVGKILWYVIKIQQCWILINWYNFNVFLLMKVIIFWFKYNFFYFTFENIKYILGHL